MPGRTVPADAADARRCAGSRPAWSCRRRRTWPGTHPSVGGQPNTRWGARARLGAQQPTGGHLPGGGRDRVGAGQGREGGLRAQPPGMRPADQHLGGADGPHPGQLQPPRRHRGHQSVQVGSQPGGLDGQALDALGGQTQRLDRHAMLQRPGRPVPEPYTARDLAFGGQPAKLSPQLLGRPDDQPCRWPGRVGLGTPRGASVTGHNPGGWPGCSSGQQSGGSGRRRHPRQTARNQGSPRAPEPFWVMPGCRTPKPDSDPQDRP